MLLGVGSVLCPAEAAGQTLTMRPPSQPQRAVASSEEETASLRTQLGVERGEALLRASDVRQRIRGIDRLAGIGTAEAIDLLAEEAEQGSLFGDSRTRLAAVRALAPFAKNDRIRLLLARELNEPQRNESAPATHGLVRDTAALALARTGEKKAVLALVAALLQGGAAGEAASRALRAYPPVDVAWLFGEGRAPLHPNLVRFLGDLGDLRAIGRLRGVLDQSDGAARLAAALALAKLGDERPLASARAWQKSSDPSVRLAAAEILLGLGAKDGLAALAHLLDSEPTRVGALDLAMRVGGAELSAHVARVIPRLSAEDRPKAIAVLGRTGGPVAVRELLRLLAGAETSMPAAHALAMMPGAEAGAALERAIAAARSGAARRMMARASLVRALARSDRPPGLESVLDAMLASTDSADRATAAFGLVALGERDLDELTRTKDDAIACAAARGALASGRDALGRLLEVLEASTESMPHDAAPSPRVVAAGLALLVAPEGGAVPTSTLAAWAESGGPLAPLAARALPSRDHDALRPRIERLLEGTDPIVRAHVALGLGRDPEADSVSLLTERYAMEDDPMVRQAIVRGLSRRTEVQRNATLARARDLDPDEGTRILARQALEGRVLDHVTPASRDGQATLPRGLVGWIAFRPNSAEASKDVRLRSAIIVRDDGLGLPVVSDPDGVLLIPGLAHGEHSLVLEPLRGPSTPQR